MHSVCPVLGCNWQLSVCLYKFGKGVTVVDGRLQSRICIEKKIVLLSLDGPSSIVFYYQCARHFCFCSKKLKGPCSSVDNLKKPYSAMLQKRYFRAACCRIHLVCCCKINNILYIGSKRRFYLVCLMIGVQFISKADSMWWLSTSYSSFVVNSTLWTWG